MTPKTEEQFEAGGPDEGLNCEVIVGVIEIPHDSLKLRMIVSNDEYNLHFELVNMNGQPSSPKYRYSSETGQLQQHGTFSGAEWIGIVSVSYGIFSRTATIVKLLCNLWGLPDTLEGLNQLIDKRKVDGLDHTWRMQLKSEKRTQMGLVSLSALALMFQKAKKERTNPDQAIVSQTAVAPHRQHQGYGLLMHEVVAGYLKAQEYKYLLTDAVGMNTEGELAVWAALEKKGYPVAPFTDDFYVLRLMFTSKFINRVLYNYTRKKVAMHLGSELMTLEKAEKTQFQQYEMKLIPETTAAGAGAETGAGVAGAV